MLPHDLVVPPSEHDHTAAVSSQDHAVSDAASGASGLCCVVAVTSCQEASGGSAVRMGPFFASPALVSWRTTESNGLRKDTGVVLRSITLALKLQEGSHRCGMAFEGWLASVCPHPRMNMDKAQNRSVAPPLRMSR